MTPEHTKKCLRTLAGFAEMAARRQLHYGGVQDMHRLANLQHIQGMGERACKLVDEGRIEKAMRWLGFMQGALWALGVVDLDTLKKMNMPEGAEFDRDRG